MIKSLKNVQQLTVSQIESQGTFIKYYESI